MATTSARACVVALLALLGFPTPASAATTCVPDASPGGCDAVQPTIQGAVDAAADGDTIRIAAGRYEEAVHAGAKILHFVGAGAGQTGISPGLLHDGPTLPGLSMPRGGSVTSLGVAGGSVMFGSGAPGLVFAPEVEGSFNLSLSHVGLSGGVGDRAGAVGLAIGATPPTIARATIEDAVVRGGSGASLGGAGAEAVALGGSGAGPIAIDRSVLEGGYSRFGQSSALNVGGAATNVAHSDLRGGAGVWNRGSLTVVGSTLAGNAVGLGVSAPGSAIVSDSVVSSRAAPRLAGVESAAAIVTGSDAGPASLVASGTTFYAGGWDPDAGVVVRRSTDTNQPASAELRNSIVHQGAADPADGELVADRAQIAADYSAFRTARADNGGSVPLPGSAHNVSADPGLADAAAGDFMLLPTSPLIDGGDPTIVTAGELDRAGNPRSADGDGDCVAAPDIGAYERPDVCGRPTISAFSTTNRLFAPVAPSRSAWRRRVKRGTTFRYTLSEAASVAIAIDRRLPGRRVGETCRKPTRRNRRAEACTRFRRAGVLRAPEEAGRQSLRFSGRFGSRPLRRGQYRARIVATDLQGALSRPRRLRFRIVRP